MATLENSPKNYTTLINEITSGQVKIPQFQRDFVWDKVTSARLIDSMLKGYPIGTFIFWRTDEELRSVRNIGKINLPQQKHGEFVNYVLDGQQRITSIFAAIKGEKILREDGKVEDFAGIYIDLKANQDGDIVILDVSQRTEKSYISLTDLMEGSFQLLGSVPIEVQPKIEEYISVLKGYSFNVINLKNASIDVATEVFTRLNVGGKALTLFEIMVAKTYDGPKKFDLAERYRQLRIKLHPVGYDTIPTATVLQVVSILIKRDVKRSTILKINKAEFIAMWDDAVNSIERAVDFFRSYGVVVSRLLPYPTLIVPFAYFFHKHPSNPTGDLKKMLEDFFWRVSLGTRYSAGVESKIVQDVEKIDRILKGKLPKYEWSIDISESILKSDAGMFATGRSFVKAILCLYAIQKPKSFNSGLDVQIANNWLKVSTSKNYHHFFPKAYMKKTHPHMSNNSYNHILNITIVDDYLNKTVIKAKAPATYMKGFVKENENIEKTMKSHLIGSLERFGIMNNDYTKFMNERAKWVSKELSKRIIEQRTGAEEQIEEGEISEADLPAVENIEEYQD